MSILMQLCTRRSSVHALLRNYHNRCRIGDREVVGYGINGSFVYFDHPAFPFPAIRFKETCGPIRCLREKEMGDWRCLTMEEKKCLYRASFCATFAEFQSSTGQIKAILGGAFMLISLALFIHTFMRCCVYDKWPETFSQERQEAQLRRIIDLRVDVIDGLVSKWDYARNDWKSSG